MNRDGEGTALEAVGLGKRYRRRRGPVLQDCSFHLPAGRICALVGPNGTGKSTLLALAAGLIRPTEGTLKVLGTTPARARERFAYVAQAKPLPPQLTVAATLRLGAELNRARWDREAAERIAYGPVYANPYADPYGEESGSAYGDMHGEAAADPVPGVGPGVGPNLVPGVVREGGLHPRDRIRSLSGGQRTRVALALAFGKRPELMLLDEPMADLDPLARRELLGALLGEAAEHGTTIVMSSHVVAELEGVCDHLFLMGGGRIRLGGDPEQLLAAHTLLTGPARDLSGHTVVESHGTGRQLTALIRTDGPNSPPTDGWETAAPSLEELLLAHLRNPEAPDLFTEETGGTGTADMTDVTDVTDVTGEENARP
ncbi:ABC transporter ATP-binding protein [Streptomyces dioscori]|uniref:ABC transporter ATP-binding protein n=1 Tax=Streptomyces dioscori TaxID=2109333 RepID=A0A2P8QDN3_9ACTN|nr:ABC transporter ATP-binding protein [Streptomyces dioscori]PSM44351.1 ABC transporter ATP-binding protein [Streptomyces dioscori]